MDYFDNEKNVQEYIEMFKGYDGSELINELRKYVKDDALVLELGMGPGFDLDILKKYYNIIGSDKSKIFIDRYRKSNPDITVMQLDAIKLEINMKFDCIYSNKVMVHFTKAECIESVKKQKEILNPNGFLFHTFWNSNKTEEFDGLFFQYYTEDELKNIFIHNFNIIELKRYSEIEVEDSILIIVQNKKN
jgi:trans-aconitate methyltransferase